MEGNGITPTGLAAAGRECSPKPPVPLHTVSAILPSEPIVPRLSARTRFAFHPYRLTQILCLVNFCIEA